MWQIPLVLSASFNASQHLGSLVVQRVNNLPARQDSWVEKIPWRRKWQPTPVFLPGEFHGQRSLAGCSPWGHKQSHMTEWLRHTQHLHYYSTSYHVCYYYIWVYCLLGFPYFTDGFVLHYLTFLSLVEWRYLIFSSGYLAYLIIKSVPFSHSVMSNSLQPHGLQHASLPCPSPTPRTCPNSCWLSQWCHPPSLPLSTPSPPAFNLSRHQGLFQWVSSSRQVAKGLELQLQQPFQWMFRTDFL